MNSVQMKVAEQIANLAPQVEDEVVSILTERELDRRTEAFVKVMDELDKLEKSVAKVQPDRTFGLDGSVISEFYSKAKLDEINKGNGKISKINAALTKALEKNDFNDVINLSNQKSGGRELSEADTTSAADQS